MFLLDIAHIVNGNKSFTSVNRWVQSNESGSNVCVVDRQVHDNCGSVTDEEIIIEILVCN